MTLRAEHAQLEDFTKATIAAATTASAAAQDPAPAPATAEQSAPPSPPGRAPVRHGSPRLGGASTLCVALRTIVVEIRPRLPDRRVGRAGHTWRTSRPASAHARRLGHG